MSKFRIITDILTLFNNDEELTSMLNGNIYPIIAPEGTVGNTLLYYKDAHGKLTTKQGVYNDTCKIYFMILTDKYFECVPIAERIDQILDGHHIDQNGKKYKCQLIDGTEDFEDGKFLQVLYYEIT